MRYGRHAKFWAQIAIHQGMSTSVHMYYPQRKAFRNGGINHRDFEKFVSKTIGRAVTIRDSKKREHNIRMHLQGRKTPRFYRFEFI